MMPSEYKGAYLYPGTIAVKTEPYEVTTVLGSCVSVCLWDKKRAIGGINHYLLPLWNGEGLPSPRYGNIAIQKLIDRMLALGCYRRTLRAKVFGGAMLFVATNKMMNVGGRNVLLAESMLAEEGIELVSSDVGGVYGRKIIFNVLTGVVRVKKLNTSGLWKRREGSGLSTIGEPLSETAVS
jgi:chemotaxis protein CheD